MTNTPTSGAAIQRYKIGYHAEEWSQRDRTPSGIPDASGSWVRYADHVTALAAGQAAAAPAEPDPTPGDHPQPCDSELFESGVSVGLFDIPQWTAEALCKGIAAATGARVDWHYIGGRVHVKALPAPTSAEGAAYAALPDEREMLKHALWLASSFTVHRYLMSNAEGRWSGAEKATCHDELCCLYVAVFRGVEVDRVRVDLDADWVAVHDATQELTDHLDVVIGFPLKGVPDYEALAPKFFAHFHRLATRALRASHGQAPAGAGEYSALVCDYCGARTPDPWHSSGMLHGKMSKHIHSCDACAARGVATSQPTQPDPAYSAACNLATALFKKYFAHLPDFASGQAVWGLCGSTAGVISQIDNMVSGLLQPPTTAFSEDELE